LIYGANLRKEANCSGGVPSKDQFQMKFKNAWHPKFKPCPSYQASTSLEETAGSDERSSHPDLIPKPHHAVRAGTVTTPTKATTVDDYLSTGDLSGVQGFTYCPKGASLVQMNVVKSPDPPFSVVPSCNSYQLFTEPDQPGLESTALIV
jgi:hypothetical protein